MADALVLRTEAFVREQLRRVGPDSSHDWWHVHRVRNMALMIAREEELPSSSYLTIELAALLHDIGDYKYSASGRDERGSVQRFLEAEGVDEAVAENILRIIAGVGFKDELGGPRTAPPVDVAVVQDADRLDALGALGVARCLTFGGRFGRTLYEPDVAPREGLTRAQYIDPAARPTTLNHFPEKLLKLKGMMKTRAGHRIAEGRHQYMEAFLQRFLAEWDALL